METEWSSLWKPLVSSPHRILTLKSFEPLFGSGMSLLWLRLRNLTSFCGAFKAEETEVQNKLPRTTLINILTCGSAPFQANPIEVLTNSFGNYSTSQHARSKRFHHTNTLCEHRSEYSGSPAQVWQKDRQCSNRSGRLVTCASYNLPL